MATIGLDNKYWNFQVYMSNTKRGINVQKMLFKNMFPFFEYNCKAIHKSIYIRYINREAYISLRR